MHCRLLQQVPNHEEGYVDDTINKYKNKLIHMLRTIKVEGGLEDIAYKRLYSTGAGPKCYGLHKIHRPIVSSSGAVAYG